MLKFEYLINKAIEFILFYLSKAFWFGGLLGGIWVIAYQMYIYLKHGHWPAYSVNYIISKGGPKLNQWASYPDDWAGLHSVFSFIPLSLTLLVLGVLIGAFLNIMYSTFKRDNDLIFKK